MRPAASVEQSGRGGFDVAAVFRWQLIEVKLDAVFHDAPFGAALMLRDGSEACFRRWPQRKQLARVVAYTFWLAFASESFRRAAPSFRWRVHMLIMSYHKFIDL